MVQNKAKRRSENGYCLNARSPFNNRRYVTYQSSFQTCLFKILHSNEPTFCPVFKTQLIHRCFCPNSRNYPPSLKLIDLLIPFLKTYFSLFSHALILFRFQNCLCSNLCTQKCMGTRKCAPQSQFIGKPSAAKYSSSEL